MSRTIPRLLFLAMAITFPTYGQAGVPVIYSTDLYHPHDDPDDHYDLATLFALPELDVQGIIIDMSNIHQLRGDQASGKKPGVVALQQMFHLSGKTVPYVLGLDQPLRSADDQALDQQESVQGAVRMILATLRAAEEKVCIFTTGSLRDVAVAYNREPELMRSKVRAIYVNAGTGPDGYQEEWNVLLDPNAFRRVLLSELPIQWYPCFGRDDYFTYFRVDQTEVVSSCPAPLRAFFAYALTRSQDEPISYLNKVVSAPEGPRNMWCTPAFIDLAGRKIYRTSNGFEALARPPRTDATEISCFEMQPLRLTETTGPENPRASETKPFARYIGRDKDLLGKTSFQPDGEPDCRVMIEHLPARQPILSATLSGPRSGAWLSRVNPQRWLLKTEWENDFLILSFSYWAPGLHQLELTFDNDRKHTVTFHVPAPNSPFFVATRNTSESNVRVLHKREPEYKQVLTSCLKNILESFPRGD